MASKNILLMGASGGLGKHFAAGFADEGFNLALHFHDHSDSTVLLEKELSNKNIKVKSFKADITSEEEIVALVENVKNEFGSIDILINNAGISKDGVSWKLPLESWNKVLAVNLTGPFLCIKHILPIMRENNWGRIINISSVVPQIGVAGTAAYSVSKSGLAGLTKTVAKETSKNNITINTISLGYFDAGMLYQIPEEMRDQIRNTIPKKSFGNPMEIVQCMLFLCNENASYITGQIININGGLY
jgi:3-oxoacyl-[acyl-carrier protein] reductase